MWDLSSPIRPGIEPRVPYIGRRILNHWTTGNPSLQLLTWVSDSGSLLLTVFRLWPLSGCVHLHFSLFSYFINIFMAPEAPPGRGPLLALLCVFQPQLHIRNIWEGRLQTPLVLTWRCNTQAVDSSSLIRVNNIFSAVSWPQSIKKQWEHAVKCLDAQNNYTLETFSWLAECDP